MTPVADYNANDLSLATLTKLSAAMSQGNHEILASLRDIDTALTSAASEKYAFGLSYRSWGNSY